MPKKEVENTPLDYQGLINRISIIFMEGRQKASIAINQYLKETYWQIGQYIVEFEQKGERFAQYGEGLLERLSKDLRKIHGKGFSLSNIQRIRQFYLVFPNHATLSHDLSWSHYLELLKIENHLERNFYLNQSINEN